MTHPDLGECDLPTSPTPKIMQYEQGLREKKKGCMSSHGEGGKQCNKLIFGLMIHQFKNSGLFILPL